MTPAPQWGITRAGDKGKPAFRGFLVPFRRVSGIRQEKSSTSIPVSDHPLYPATRKSALIIPPRVRAGEAGRAFYRTSAKSPRKSPKTPAPQSKLLGTAGKRKSNARRWQPLIPRIDKDFLKIPGIRDATEDYRSLVAEAGWSGGELEERHLRALEDFAVEQHRAGTGSPVEVAAFDFGGFRFVFDMTNERVIFARGRSRRVPPRSRDQSYHAGYPGTPGFQKGHALAHSIGGPTGGPNYFPQIPQVNQRAPGKIPSPLGGAWNDIEAYAAVHPGTTIIIRFIYPTGSSAQTPAQVELAVGAEGELRNLGFPNTRPP